MPKLSSSEQLHQLLDTGAELTLEGIQQQLGLTGRQINRLINHLRAQHVSVGERWVDGRKVFFLPPTEQRAAVTDLRFDSDELRALSIAAKASQSLLGGTPHADALRRAFDKLLEKARPVSYLFNLDESMQDWQFDQNAPDQIVLDHFRQLETAMDERQPVRIDYFTAGDGRASTGRKVNPYCFYKKGRAWLLVAWCHERRALRNFSLTRISRVDACPGEGYEIASDFDADTYFRFALGALNSGESDYYRLLVEPAKAIHFRERQYHHSQMIDEERADGRLVVSFDLEGFEEIRSFCQSWGTGVTVLEPARLRGRLLTDALELINRYCRPTGD